MSDRSRVVLVPGFLSPQWLLWPLKRALQTQFDVVSWDKPVLFGQIDETIDDLCTTLASAGDRRPVNVVTHSFGDWYLRQALCRHDLAVGAVVALAPVREVSPPARWVAGIGGGRVREIDIMSDHDRAMAGIDVMQGIDSLVIWAHVDPWIVRPDDTTDCREVSVVGTHNTLPWLPKVHRLVAQHLADSATETQGG